MTFVAENYAARDFAVASHTTAKGIALSATNSPFATVLGQRCPVRSGPVLDLVMVMAGRAAHLHNLTGSGVAILTERLRNH
ncbi:hypothetical protein [Cryobacterium luteum]|uniref:hypothetical protein n=1 Tax=Cryobacterium luteum TaxID=1424661 RepID=UPI001F547F66|nr:hypothetical protein [Cryobacterium luteum]